MVWMQLEVLCEQSSWNLKTVKCEKVPILFLCGKHCLFHCPLPKNLTRAEVLNHNREVMCVGSGPICSCSPTDMCSPVLADVEGSVKSQFYNSRYSRIPPITANYDLINTLLFQIAIYLCSPSAEVSIQAEIILSIWRKNRLQLISQL